MLKIMKSKKHYWLYVLKLEQGKYYVGITSKTPEERFKEHMNGFFAAEWTKVYKPIKIIQTADLRVTTYERAEAYENKVTRKYIKSYGIKNVRGGNLTFSRGNYLRIFNTYYQGKTWQDTSDIICVLILMVVFGLYTLIDLIFDKKILSPLLHLIFR